MERLGPQDASFLYLETPSVHQHVGGAAILTKVHHCMVDGLAAIDLASAVYDFAPEPQILTPPPWEAEPEPSRLDLLVDAVSDQVTHPVKALADLAQRTLQTPARVARQAEDIVSGLLDILGAGVLAPAGPFNRRVGPNRRFAMVEAPVQTFKDIKRALGATVNDVVLATVAGGLYRFLRHRKEPTRERVLRAMVPVSVRSKDERSAMGNRVSSIFVDLPVGRMGGKKRLALIRERTKHLKGSNYAVGAEFLMNIGSWAPPTIHPMGARPAARARGLNPVGSNVPGPQVPMYIAGAKLLAQYPVMPIADAMGLSIATTSLAGTMAFGLTADWDTLPDIEFLARAVEESLIELQ